MAIVIDNTTGSIAGVTQPMGVGAAVASTDALQASQALGFGQTWQSVTRTSGTTYTNSTGKPIELKVRFAASTTVQVTIGGYAFGATSTTTTTTRHETFIVPIGATYVITVSAGSISTDELR